MDEKNTNLSEEIMIAFGEERPYGRTVGEIEDTPDTEPGQDTMTVIVY